MLNMAVVPDAATLKSDAVADNWVALDTTIDVPSRILLRVPELEAEPQS